MLWDKHTKTIVSNESSEIIRAMLEHIEVHAGSEKGKPDVILVGALAQILAYTQNQTAALEVENGGRVLMVAGVGFEPTTLSLCA